MSPDPQQLRRLAEAIEGEKYGGDWVRSILEQLDKGKTNPTDLASVSSSWGAAIQGHDAGLRALREVFMINLPRLLGEAQQRLVDKRVAAETPVLADLRRAQGKGG